MKRSTVEHSSMGLVVVNFGSSDLIRTNLSDVLAAFPAVVVDNFTSTDEQVRVADLAAEAGADVIRSPTNSGFGEAVNRGVGQLIERGVERVLLVNPDVHVSEQQVLHLSSVSASDPDAIMSPIILNGIGQTWFRGGVLDRHRIVATHADPTGPDVELDWLTGACLLVPAAAWRQLGGFSSDYFLYWEDV
ncbi:MAG: glycosyl transferase family 2, partial [Microbacteriaceae bacterium]